MKPKEGASMMIDNDVPSGEVVAKMTGEAWLLPPLPWRTAREGGCQ